MKIYEISKVKDFSAVINFLNNCQSFFVFFLKTSFVVLLIKPSVLINVSSFSKKTLFGRYKYFLNFKNSESLVDEALKF